MVFLYKKLNIKVIKNTVHTVLQSFRTVQVCNVFFIILISHIRELFHARETFDTDNTA